MKKKFLVSLLVMSLVSPMLPAFADDSLSIDNVYETATQYAELGENLFALSAEEQIDVLHVLREHVKKIRAALARAEREQIEADTRYIVMEVSEATGSLAAITGFSSGLTLGAMASATANKAARSDEYAKLLAEYRASLAARRAAPAVAAAVEGSAETAAAVAQELTTLDKIEARVRATWKSISRLPGDSLDSAKYASRVTGRFLLNRGADLKEGTKYVFTFKKAAVVIPSTVIIGMIMKWLACRRVESTHSERIRLESALRAVENQLEKYEGVLGPHAT